MKSIGTSTNSLVLAVVVTLVASSCNLVRRAAGIQPANDTSKVTVAFDPATLGDLADAIKQLKIDAYVLEGESDDSTANLEKSETIEITPQQTSYTISGIRIGWKKFVVSILDANDEALGQGSVKHLVTPGENQTDELVIRLKSIETPTRDVEVKVSLNSEEGFDLSTVETVIMEWSTENSGQSDTVELQKVQTTSYADDVSYDTLKPIIDKGCATADCHDAAEPKKGLDLSQFPFTQVKRNGTVVELDRILEKIMDRVIEEQDMPDPLDVDQGKAEWDGDPSMQLFNDWAANDFAETSGDGGNNPGPGTDEGVVFTTTLEDLPIADNLISKITAKAAGDATVFSKTYDPVVIEAEGAVKFEADVSVEEAQIAIPVRVEREAANQTKSSK